MARPIYLDYNATTPHHPEVIEAMRPFWQAEFGNPSSSHWYGTIPRRAVEKARDQVAELLGCRSREIVFTSGGTEANNYAIRGMARAMRDRGNHLITSAIEHPAILEVCRFLEQDGFQVSYLPVDQDGLVDPAEVEKAIRPATILITIMHANNEVGTVQPLAEISALARKNGVVLHTDAAQSVGKIATEVDYLGVDLLSVAGHKLYGPKGIGALYLRSPLVPQKFCLGAGQEMGFRAGTENVAGIVGLGAACAIARRDLGGKMEQVKRLRDRLYQGLRDQLTDLKLNGHPELRLPNTLSISFKGLPANRLLEEIGLEVAASAGAACHSDTIRISHVLQAMQLPLEWAKGTVRFSLGRMTTDTEIDTAIAIIAGAVRGLRSNR